MLAKSPKADVYKQMLADLDAAIAALPDAPYTDGHVVKGTALLLKAKYLLYDQKYQEAAAAAQQVIGSGKFHLYSDYEGLFEAAGQGADNTEIMFSVRYLSPNFENISKVRWGWWMSMLPYQNLVDEYECTDGKSMIPGAIVSSISPFR